MVAILLTRPPAIGADGAGGGGFIAPSFGTVTPGGNSLIFGPERTYTLAHSHTSGGILFCVAFKGSTDVGPPTYTIDEVVYNSTALTEIGRTSSNTFAGQPTVLAFFNNSIATTTGAFSITVTASAGDLQCIGMVGVDLVNADAVGSGVNQTGSSTVATSQSISVTTGQDNSRVFGITAARADANGGNITATTSGYSVIANFGTDFSSSTDIGMAVHTLIKGTAGSQAYASSWPNSAAYAALAFELEGVAA